MPRLTLCLTLFLTVPASSDADEPEHIPSKQAGHAFVSFTMRGEKGALALLLAAEDKRIDGVIAYAPVTDVLGHLGEDKVDAVTQQILTDFRAYVEWSSPLASEEGLLWINAQTSRSVTDDH